jgi:7-cyano-7-deazaguanine synthase
MPTRQNKTIVVLSGGLDSTTLLYELLEIGDQIVAAVSFNYGQRHKKELSFAQATCEKLDINHILIDLWSSGLPEALSSSESSLISDTAVPEGHYAQETMKATVVPNRNMIMLSMAAGIAVAKGANRVATAVHAGDHFIYPDCRPEFIRAVSNTTYCGNESFGELWSNPIVAPYLYITKEDIAHIALTLEVPLEETWSCYKGGDIHCGRCGTCVERLEAIHGAIAMHKEETGLTTWYDRTRYADSEFWKEAIANANTES